MMVAMDGLVKPGMGISTLSGGRCVSVDSGDVHAVLGFRCGLASDCSVWTVSYTTGACLRNCEAKWRSEAKRSANTAPGRFARTRSERTDDPQFASAPKSGLFDILGLALGYFPPLVGLTLASIIPIWTTECQRTSVAGFSSRHDPWGGSLHRLCPPAVASFFDPPPAAATTLPPCHGANRFCSVARC